MRSHLPPGYRRGIKTLLTVGWLCSAGAGLGGVVIVFAHILGPPFVSPFAWWIIGCGAVLFIASLAAACGVLFDRHRVEWTGSWFAAFGLAPFLFMHWWNALVDNTTRIPYSLLLTFAFCTYLVNALQCGAHARKMRAVHTTMQGVTEHDDGTDGSSDGNTGSGPESTA